MSGLKNAVGPGKPNANVDVRIVQRGINDHLAEIIPKRYPPCCAYACMTRGRNNQPLSTRARFLNAPKERS